LSGITTALAATGLMASRANAAAASSAADGPPHKIVYQLNRADEDYIEHILNSISAMLTKYVDDVAIAIVAFGPGIHVLGTRPTRPISEAHRKRIKGMAQSYGVELIACGNTMKGLNWDEQRIIPEARIEEVGAAALMTLQEKGYAYIAW
jgi:intracellular sulfur oxidation DsrE/DsrF family protein